MSIHDMELANDTGANFRADANLALAALVSLSSNATAPTTTFAYMWWADTTSGWLKIRNAANSDWIEVFRLSDIAFKDTTFAVVDNGDVTKKIVFQVSSLTTGQTRTITWQDQSGTAALLENIQAQTGVAYTTGGSSTAFTLTPNPALTTLAENQEFDVEFHTAAGTTPTLAVSGLTAKNLKYRDSTGTLQAVTSTQVPSGWRSKVTYDGTDYIVREVPPSVGGLTLGTMQTFSGTSQDFTSLPSGIKLLLASFKDISQTGNSNPMLQIGDSGGVETSGYVGQTQDRSSVLQWSGGVPLDRGNGNPGYQLSGWVAFVLMDAATNLFSIFGGVSFETSGGTDYNCTIAGYKALSATLDRIRLTTVAGSDSGDGGSWNITYLS